MGLLKTIGVLGGGLVIGAIGGSVVVGVHYNKIIRQQFVYGVVGQVLIADQIRGGTGSELAQRIEQKLPQQLLFLERTFDREAVLPAYWSVRDFYLKTGTPVPEEIQSILSELPPTPASSCNAPEVIPSVGAEEVQNPISEEPG